jgi:hypothetical protein
MELRTIPIVVALLALPATALAQGASAQAEAQALFDEGRKLMESGKYADACPKLEASQKLDPGAGTLLNLARCYEKAGQTASAWVTYTDAATASAASGHPDWADKARARVAELGPKLSRLTVIVTANVAGLEVLRDGAPVSTGAWGTPLPVDPGEHVIEARAPHKSKWRTKIVVKADASTVEARVPALVDAGPEDDASTPVEERSGKGNLQRVLGVGVGALGLVGVGIGAAFGVDAASKKNVVADPRYCVVSTTQTRCNAQGAAIVDDARTSATISTIVIAVGAAAAVGGVVLYLTAPRGKEAPKTGVRVEPSAAGALVGVTVGGAF